LDLPLAVVIDGSVFSRPTISTVLTDELQLCFPYHLKGPELKTQESEAKPLGASLTGRPMRVRLLHKTAEDRKGTGPLRVTNSLTRAKVPSRSGRPWTIGSVRAILATAARRAEIAS
jgi:hypothetical protein